MPEIRKAGLLAIIVTVGLGMASCSMLPEGFDGAVDDSIKYRSNDASIKALAIPPGLSQPGFDETYAVSDAPVSSVASASQPQRKTPAVQVALSKLKTGEPMLAVNAPLDKSWPWVGAMLQRVGFNVVKQQPAEGIYTTEYQGAPGEKQSFTDKLNSMVSGVTFGRDAGNRLRVGETYLVVMSGNSAQQSFVFVADKNGKPASAEIATQVLTRLKAEFER
ncbi:MAG: outer membrane protein assembly factor BamC [Thiolinea sp.]